MQTNACTNTEDSRVRKTHRDFSKLAKILQSDMEVLISVMACMRQMGGMQKKLIIPTKRIVNLEKSVAIVHRNLVGITHR